MRTFGSAKRAGLHQERATDFEMKNNKGVLSSIEAKRNFLGVVGYAAADQDPVLSTIQHPSIPFNREMRMSQMQLVHFHWK
jgi:hypothetical protein